MTTKEYLSQFERLSYMITNKSAEIDRWRTLACNTSCPTDKERVQTSGTGDMVGVASAAVVDIERDIKVMIKSLRKMQGEIEKQIESLPNLDEYNALHSKYILLMTADNIALRMGWSRSKFWRVHDRALDNFQKKYGSVYLEKEAKWDELAQNRD